MTLPGPHRNARQAARQTGAVAYAIIAAMAKRNPARPGEQLKDALITVDDPVWTEFKQLMRANNTSASAHLRAYMARKVRAAKRTSRG